ncbi:hypothetical protein QBC44DRAFT_253199 [Cladorrhinum sp. PSN332]|nr:hypothetical protein QBC44DRAFT_253199 [Cladorrhinum sp. PSN332]
MTTDKEHIIQKALSEFKRGRALATIAEDYTIPERTLRNRIHGTLPPTKSHQQHQKLSQEQKSYLYNWILHIEAYSHTPTQIKTRGFASQILAESGNNRDLEKN